MRTFIIILLANSLGLAALAQDFSLSKTSFVDHYSMNKKTKAEKFSVRKPTNELEFTTFALFAFYKEFISSQDDSKCNFHPSCSVYAMHSIQQKGLFAGTLNAFDRLTRCNGLNVEDYEITPYGLLLDPVD